MLEGEQKFERTAQLGARMLPLASDVFEETIHAEVGCGMGGW